jgi:hypothetical protein
VPGFSVLGWINNKRGLFVVGLVLFAAGTAARSYVVEALGMTVLAGELLAMAVRNRHVTTKRTRQSG